MIVYNSLDRLFEQANYYKLLAEQLERNPVLALDYLKRAYQVTDNADLKKK